MDKEDWLRIVKLSGYVYLPIILMLALIFVLGEYYRMQKVNEAQQTLFNSQENAQFLTK